MSATKSCFEESRKSFGKVLPLDTDIRPNNLISNQDPDADAGQCPTIVHIGPSNPEP